MLTHQILTWLIRSWLGQVFSFGQCLSRDKCNGPLYLLYVPDCSISCILWKSIFLLQKIKKYDKFKTWHSVQSFLLALLEVGVLGCSLAFNVIKNWIITRVIFFFANDPCVVTSHLQFNFKKIQSKSLAAAEKLLNVFQIYTHVT